MSKRNREKRTCSRQEKRKEIINAMTKFQGLGLVGETIEVDGDIGWNIGPEHQAKMQALAQTLLSNPERWDEIPQLRDRKDDLLAMRKYAIEHGYIAVDQ